MFLSGNKDGIVVDIGGTTTDVGVLVKGFPREASSQVKVIKLYVFLCEILMYFLMLGICGLP